MAALHFYTKLRLVVDLQTCAKAQQSRAYARKVKLTNLQQMANTICVVQELGFNDQSDISAEQDRISLSMRKIKKGLRDCDDHIRDLNEQIHYAGQLYTNRNIIFARERIASAQHGSDDQFMQDHNKEYMLWQEAQNYFSKRDLPTPDLQFLKRERDRYFMLKRAQLKAFRNFKAIRRELDTVSTNVETILSYTHTHDQKRETAQDR